MTEPRVGDYVTKTVRLTKALRRGGMGSVWLAHHDALDTEVVVKFLISSLSGDELNRERFLREAAAAAKVHSPHVVRTYDHGVMDGAHPFIVMEYLEGEDLAQVLHKRRILEVEQVAHIVDQAGRALDAAHRRGIVHRDVKPANIFLIDVGARHPHVKLVDFGVAKASQMMTLTSTGELVGTPVYMSPEQIAGHAVDHRSDLWSLGVVAFRALTGERPFLGDTVASVTYQVVHSPLPHPSDRRPQLERSIDEWFARACAHDSAERFSSAREMADALWEAIGMPQSAPWSTDSVPGRVGDQDEATLLDQPEAKTSPTAPGGELQAAGQPTAGSLRSSVATVTPVPRSRWRTLALFLGIPLALAAGYGIATVGSSDPGTPVPADAATQGTDEATTSVPATSPPHETPSTPEPSVSSATSASASASAAPAASAVPKLRPRIPPRPSPTDVSPDDLGF